MHLGSNLSPVGSAPNRTREHITRSKIYFSPLNFTNFNNFMAHQTSTVNLYGTDLGTDSGNAVKLPTQPGIEIDMTYNIYLCSITL